MKSWLSKKFASKVGAQSLGTQFLSIPPEQVLDLPSQIARIEAEFKKQCPKSFIIPFCPTMWAVTPSHLVLSDSNKILFFDVQSNEIIEKDYSQQIQSMSYAKTDDLLYISGSSILKISLKTLEIVSELAFSLTYLKIFQDRVLTISSDQVQSFTPEGNFVNLYDHPEAFMLDSNGTFIFSLSNYLVKAYSDTVVFQYDQFSHEATFLASSSNFLAICGSFYCVLIINLLNWEPFTIFHYSMNKHFFCMSFKPDSDLLIASGCSKLELKDLGSLKAGISLLKNEKDNKVCGFLQDQRAFSCNDFKLKIFAEYDINEMNDKFEVKLQSFIKGLTQFNELAIVYSEKEIFTIDFEYFNVTSPFHSGKDEILSVTGGNKLMVSMTGSILLFNTELVLERKIEMSEHVLGIMEYGENIIAISSNSLKLIDPTNSIPLTFSYNKKSPTSWTLYKASAIVGDDKGTIKIISLSSGLSTNTLSISNSKVLSIATLELLNYLLAVDTRSEIKIWNLNTFECFYEVSSSNCSKIFTGFEHYLFSLSEGKNIEIWDLNNYEKFTVLKSPESLTSILSIKDRVVGISEKSVIFFNNPLLTTKIQVFGIDSEDVQNYKSKILLVMSGKKCNKTKNYSDCIISPYKFNLLLLSACFNNKEVLERELKISSLHQSTCGETAISICMKKNFVDLTRILFKHLKEQINSNPYSLYYLENTFLELNKSNVPGLCKLYKLAMGVSVTKHLPKFCINSQDLPIVLESPNIFTIPSQFMPLYNYSNLGKAISFSHTFIKISTTLGSQESVDFINSLVMCSSPEIFKTQLIKTLLSQKWKKVRIFILGQGIVYLFYMVSLAVFLTKYQNSSVLVIPFTLSGALLAYEIFQMSSGLESYLSDVWNLVDIVRACLFFIYCILFWTSASENNELLSVIIFLTWSRGITYFRLFSGTRYYINLLFAIIQDMSSFFIIFFYSIVGFGLVFYTLSSSTDYFYFLTSTYILNFGNFDTNNYDKLEWIFFLLVTVLNPIIMLNLLISIMSDTYSRVKHDFETADLLGLCYLIKEVELLLFWRRNLNDRKYLHVCQVEKSKEDGTGVDGDEKYLKDILKTIKRLGVKIENENNFVIRGISGVQTSFGNFNVNVNEIKKKLSIR